MKQLLIGLLFVFGLQLQAQDDKLSLDAFFEVPLEQLDPEALAPLSIDDLNRGFERAVGFLNDTTVADNELKGQIYLAVLADHIKKRIESEDINTRKRDVRKLLKRFEAEDYFIDQGKIPDFLKLMHYSCEGRFEYIYSRFKFSSFFYAVMIALVIGIVFGILNVSGKLRWKYRRLANKIMLVMAVLALILVLIFKFTCDQYVLSDSFYGIPM